MEFKQVDIDNFKRGGRENPIFWSRFRESTRLAGATVLDVGSGWGRLCVDIAQAGAVRVIGWAHRSNYDVFCAGGRRNWQVGVTGRH